MRPRPRPALLVDQEPEVQLCFYRDAVVKTERTAHGGHRSYLVDPQQLARVMAGVPLTSGGLLPGTLATGWVGGIPFYVLVLAAQVVTIEAEMVGGVRSYTFQTPPLIWAGHGQDYRLWALAMDDSWPWTDRPLYRAPFPNVYDSGAVCWGTAPRPAPARPETMLPTWAAFLGGSRFSLHVVQDKSRRWPANILLAYTDLGPATPYPLEDLVPAGWSLRAVVAGTLWGGRR